MVITSSDNKTIKLVKKLLSDKKYRTSTNMFVVEGSRIVMQLIKNGHKCNFICVSHSSPVLKAYSKFNNCYEVMDKIFNTISELANSDGVIGVFENDLKQMVLEPNKKYFILDTVQNPNNLGAIYRNCLAFSIDGVILYNSVDIFNPSAIRSSMGAIFDVPTYYSTDLVSTIKLLQKNSIKVVCSILDKNSNDVRNLQCSKGLALILGNEGNGVNKKFIEICDDKVYIPISEKVDSLNVSVTSGIFAYLINNKK